MKNSSFTDQQSGDGPSARIARTDRIRRLNDEFRRAGPLAPSANRWVLTQGVDLMGPLVVARAIALIRDFSAFDTENDPYGEHDFGSFTLSGERCFWKIDYYDLARTHGSPDPADPSVTARVLTIMLASEY